MSLECGMQEGLLALIDLKSGDRFEATSDGILRRLGITMTKGLDFRKYKEIAESARSGHQVGDAFHVGLNQNGRKEALWQVGVRNGEVIHTQALRLLDLKQRDFSEFFRTEYEEFLPPGLTVEPGSVRYRPGPGAKSIRGRVVYSGETWLGGDAGCFRGTGLSNVLGKRAMLTALREFDADYVVGMMARPVAYKGFCLRMGFIHAEPYALRMKIVGQSEPLEGVFVYMSAEDIEFVLGLPQFEAEPLAA